MSKIKNPIRIGIVGYGNLGKGVEKALDQNPDMRLTAIFTRRDPESLSKDGKMMHYSTIKDFVGKIDVMILCGGSATDLPKQEIGRASCSKEGRCRCTEFVLEGE